MEKEYCIVYYEFKRRLFGERKKEWHFYTKFGFQARTVIDEFLCGHEDAIIYKVFVEYRERNRGEKE